ncbi:AlbA family DNA-binding domain-containing protein [Streptomyces spongiicola]|nr:ATP-binding protein [Streptomyces spongiicola]
MPNLAHPLFSAPVDAVDGEMVRSFLALELEESFTLDYKRNIDATADTVAAMANTYGGVVLIGVDAHPKDSNLPGGLVDSAAQLAAGSSMLTR